MNGDLDNFLKNQCRINGQGNNASISGNSDLTRTGFMAIVDEAVKTVFTMEEITKAFSATGIIPFNPDKIVLRLKFPSSSGAVMEPSPVKAT